MSRYTCRAFTGLPSSYFLIAFAAEPGHPLPPQSSGDDCETRKPYFSSA